MMFMIWCIILNRLVFESKKKMLKLSEENKILMQKWVKKVIPILIDIETKCLKKRMNKSISIGINVFNIFI